jgi:hypothetical protein
MPSLSSQGEAMQRRSCLCVSQGAFGRATAGILITVLLAGCHAQQRLDIPTEAPPRQDVTAVQPGDHVRVKLQSGTTLTFEVAEVRPDELVGIKGQRVRYGEMARLQRSHFSAGRTVVLVVGGLALLVITLTGMAYASLAGGL